VNIILYCKGHTCINANRDISVFRYTSALKSSNIRRISKDNITIKILLHVASTRLVTSNLEVFSGLLLRRAQDINEATRVFEPAMLTGSRKESFIF